MKKINISSLLLTLLLIVSPGCATFENAVNDPASFDKVVNYIKLSSEAGVRLLISKKPGSQRYVSLAIEAVNIAVLNKTVDPTAVKSLIVAKLEEKGAAEFVPYINLAIDAALMSYSKLYNMNIDQKDEHIDKYVRALEALSAGAKKAIGRSLASSGELVVPEDSDYRL